MSRALWRWALVGLLTSTCIAGGQPRASAPGTLRVVTYNQLAGDRGLQGIVSTLAPLKADLIGLQEVDNGTKRSGRVDQAAVLAKRLGMAHAFASHFDYQGGQFGVALLSRYPIVRATPRRTKGSRLSQLDATVRTPSGDVEVTVVHFTVTFPFRDEREQRACDTARHLEAKAAATHITSARGPALVLGDMNDDTGSPTYEAFAGALQDACDVKGAGFAKTWNSAFPLTRIDYVWANSRFEVLACDTVPSAASDHLPVLTELRFTR